MIVLALDPGPVTGWAILTSSGEVAGCGNLRPEDLDVSIDYLIRLAHRAGHPVEVAVTAYAGQTVQDEFVRRTIKRWLDVFELRGVPIPVRDREHSRSARDFAYPESWDGQAVTEHQRSAIATAAYYLHPGPQLRKAKAGRWTPSRA